MPHVSGKRARNLRHAWLAVVFSLWGSLGLAAPDTEQQLEAAYLVNFMKYIDWPASSRMTNTICLFGRDALAPSLAAYEGRQIGGRTLHVRRVGKPDEMADCQLLYIPALEETRTGAVLRWLDNTPCLTVSDQEGFARLGGGIELVRSGSRIQFIVNVNALTRNGLVASSQMMRLAQRAIGPER